MVSLTTTLKMKFFWPCNDQPILPINNPLAVYLTFFALTTSLLNPSLYLDGFEVESFVNVMAYGITQGFLSQVGRCG